MFSTELIMANKKNNQKKTVKATKPSKKVAKKPMGKSSTKQKNSVSKAKSTSCQKRTYHKLPQGYKATKNAKVVDGVVEIHNGKPLFTTDRYGRKHIATDRNGNPAHKKAQLVVDPQAYAEAEKQKRKNKYLRKDEVRKYTNPKHLSKQGNAHPARVIAKRKNAYKFNVITHSDNFFDEPTIKLTENPNKNKREKKDPRPSRASVPRWDNKRNFSKTKEENWHFTKQDKTKIKKNNKKYENRKSKSKKKK